MDKSSLGFIRNRKDFMSAGKWNILTVTDLSLFPQTSSFKVTDLGGERFVMEISVFLNFAKEGPHKVFEGNGGTFARWVGRESLQFNFDLRDFMGLLKFSR